MRKDDMRNEKAPRRLIPTGWRKVSIRFAEEGTSKAGKAKITINAVDIETGWEFQLHLSDVEGSRWMLKKLLESLGIDSSAGWEISNIFNREVMAFSEHEPNEWTDREGKTQTGVQHKFTDFKPCDDEVVVEQEGEDWK